MKSLSILSLLILIVTSSKSQDAAKTNIRKTEITVGTFNTISESGKVSINPVFLGYWGDYYFENRYNYEAPNSASINVGKRILRNIKHVEIIPMAGLIFGSFKGLTAELQTSLDLKRWTLSMDNQYSLEYSKGGRRLYFNWAVARFKLTNALRLGFTTFYDKEANKPGVFDKGATVAVIIKDWALRFYAFNFEIEKRYYWIGLRYTLKS